jgi:predicted membrane protein
MDPFDHDTVSAGPGDGTPQALPPPARRSRLSPQLVLGVFVIAVGVVFTLDNVGVIHAEDYLKFWPVALIAVGLLKLSQVGDASSSALGGLVFIIAGVWLLLEETAVIRVSFWDVWPLVLVLLGTYMVWQGAAGRRFHRSTPNPDPQATVSAMAILGGVEYRNSSRRFRGGNLTAIMGGCEVDLREAAIDGEAVLDVFAMWGGIEVRVPEDWVVVSHVLPLLGGSVNKTRAAGTTPHRLIVRGFVLMSGIEIKN